MPRLNVKSSTIFAIVYLSISGCSGELDNDLPKHADNKVLEHRLESLEKDVTVVSANDRHREQGSRLTKKTLGETNNYLTQLYANINSTRADDLPEWQEMYTALTDDRAIEEAGYGLGPRNIGTNFYKLKLLSDQNYTEIGQLDAGLTANDKLDVAQNKTLDIVLERLATIDRNIKNLNTAVEDKFKAVDKTLADYAGRIVGVENRMKTMEVDIDTFRQEFVSYRQRVTNLEELLRRYDLATMHNDIRNLKETTANHDQRLIDLLGRVQINSSEISVVRNDLIEAEQELSGVSSEVGNLKAGVNEIFQRLENCGCLR